MYYKKILDTDRRCARMEQINILISEERQRLYPGVPESEIRIRFAALRAGFDRTFQPGAIRLFSAPGRTELGGNHTDHQRGHVLAAAVALDDLAAAAPNSGSAIRIFSEAYGPAEISLNDLKPRTNEAGTPAALVRGVAEYLTLHGCVLPGGFDAYISGGVPAGSGLSSSAALEVLIATVLNGLFFGGKIPPELTARAGQYAENVHFGKPCGLMDQLASSLGGVVGIDFEDLDKPGITKLSPDFDAFGYTLCVIGTGAGHENLVDEYAAIPAEMAAVAGLLGGHTLRDIAPESFYDALPALRRQVPDRALLRAMHFFGEDARAQSELEALARGDFHGFLEYVRESGQSSWMLLQNIYPGGAVRDQPAALALAWCQRLLGSSGACRIHGGGFGGTILAFVPKDDAPRFKEDMERLTGAGSCRFLAVRAAGAAEIIEA